MTLSVRIKPSAERQIDRNPEKRRLYLPRTRYFIYYRPRGELLEVVAFWHASREKGPRV